MVQKEIAVYMASARKLKQLEKENRALRIVAWLAIAVLLLQTALFAWQGYENHKSYALMEANAEIRISAAKESAAGYKALAEFYEKKLAELGEAE